MRIVCGGRQDEITHRRDIDSFAVSDERSAFAYVTEKVTSVSNGVAEVISTTTMIDLKSGSSRQMIGDNSLVSTCGGIFWRSSPAARDRSGALDLTTGQAIDASPYEGFRCSSDRHVLIGHREGSRDNLYRGVPPKLKMAASGRYFNISPDGDTAAFFADDKPLCVFVGSGPAECADKPAVIPDAPSVNNSGEVLVTFDAPGGCYYRSMTDFEPAPARHANDECIGIGYWKPGRKKIRLIEPLGRAPQWIDSKTAQLLRAWAASHPR